MSKWSDIVVVSIITFIIGLLNWYATPTMSDDVLYHFVWQQEWHTPFQHIQSLDDVITSQITHYRYVNGRSITHGLAQTAINIMPQQVAKILNTTAFLLLIFLTARYIQPRKDSRILNTSIIFGMLFLIISGFGTGFIWLLGSFTYLWALLFTILFLLMIRKLKDQQMKWKYLPLTALSLLMGWTHEAIALPMAMSFLLYLIINRKHIFRQAKSYCMIAYILGMIIILISPSLWNRADIGGISLTQRLFYGCINIVLGIRISWIMITTLIIIYIKNKTKLWNIIKEFRYLFVAWIVAIAIVFCCGTTIERVPICADFIAMMIVIGIWQGERLYQYRRLIVSSICILSVCIAVPAVKLSHDNHMNYLNHRQQLEQKDSHLVKVYQLPEEMNGVIRQIAKRYIMPTIEFNFYNCYMAFDEKDINTVALAQLYGKDTVLCLPEDVVKTICNDSRHNKLTVDKHHNLFILPLNNTRKIKRIKFLLGKEVPLRFFQHILSYPDNEYELDQFNYEAIYVNEKRVLVMTIPPSNIKRRIKRIRIFYE